VTDTIVYVDRSTINEGQAAIVKDKIQDLEDKAEMLGDAGRVEAHSHQGGFMRLPSEG
jgi:hypothetical protein